jgi:hypothetical protein
MLVPSSLERKVTGMSMRRSLNTLDANTTLFGDYACTIKSRAEKISPAHELGSGYFGRRLD